MSAEHSIVERLETLEIRNRRIKRIGMVFLVLTSFTLRAAAVIESQSRPSLMRNLALAPAQISKLDWILLKAKVDGISNSIRIDESAPYWQPDYVYDARTDRVVAAVEITPDWFARTNLETVRRVLGANAIWVCVEPLIQEELRQLDASKCYARFSVLDTKSLQKKLVATYENGKLSFN